jgi:hypothetical protein
MLVSVPTTQSEVLVHLDSNQEFSCLVAMQEVSASTAKAYMAVGQICDAGATTGRD